MITSLPVSFSNLFYLSLTTLSAVTVITSFVIYVYLKNRCRFWKQQGIISPEPKLLVGNMEKLVKLEMTEAEQLDIYYKKYNTEKYIGVYYLWNPAILVTDIEIAKNIFENDFEYFTDHPNFRGHSVSDSIMDSLFTMKGDIWKTRRAVMNKLFTPRKLKEYLGDMKKSVDLLMNCLEKKLNEDIEFSSILDLHNVILVCSTMFGVDISEDSKTIETFATSANIVSKPPTPTALKAVFYTVSPNLFKLLKLSIYPFSLWKFFSNFTEQVISARKKSNVKKIDLIDILIEMREKQILNGLNITFEEAVGHIFTFFSGSHHTTELTVDHALLQLAWNPEEQTRLLEEVVSVTKGSKTITYEHLSKMEYLDAVINETLRMFPLIGVLKRVCTKRYKIDDKFTVPEGMEVIIPAASIHMDPRYYCEPEKFKPDRFYDGQSNRVAWMPFGRGPRTCIGMALGRLSVKLIIARIILNYEILPSEKMKLPMKFDPQTLFATVRPLGGFWIKLEKRKLLATGFDQNDSQT